MPTGKGLLHSKAAGFALYVLVMLVCVFGAAATDDTALPILAFVVLGCVVAGRVTLRTRAQLRQMRASKTPQIPEFPFLARHTGLLAVGTIALLLVLVGVADSGPFRIALLLLAGSVAVTAPLGQWSLRRLARRDPER